jgi:UDP-N-acetylmuramoyl-L-alanyl-D-glutamate--2,6-diaminopimelate ligase
VAFEASSHGLHQHRLDGVALKAAAFTNFTRDHLDYHGTIEAYFQAKARLFSELLSARGAAVLNADDARYSELNRICEARGVRVTSYGRQGRHYRIKRLSPTREGLAAQVEILGVSHHFMLHMYGAFQAMNALAALGLYAACGGELSKGLGHLPHLHSVAGRMEKVAEHPNGAPVFVDYAHTPTALSTVLQALKCHIKGRIVLVFGCGGDRDPGKRILMGKAAAQYADLAIVTDDNPRSEDPAFIRRSIREGAPDALEIGDRAEAIIHAVRQLGPEDALLIAGKGHEKTQIIGGRVLPFDDANAAAYAVMISGRKA